MSGGGRNRKVTRALTVPAYAWVRYFGESGHELSKAPGVSPQCIYAVSSHVEKDKAIRTEDIER